MSYNTAQLKASYTSSTKARAHILETRRPGQTWNDVTKVGINGDTFRIDRYVLVEGSDPKKYGVAKIVGFQPEEAALTATWWMPPGPIMLEYSKLKNLSHTEAAKIPMDPNQAFRHRKKRDRY